MRQAVKLNGLPREAKTAVSAIAFGASLKIGLVEAMKAHPDRLPLLHISAHGDAEGIQLSDGYVMSWAELKEHLRPINHAIDGWLIVCMSSCEGYYGVRMAMHVDDPDLPYFALVGCGSKPTWGETAVGYATLYHQLAIGRHMNDALEAMRLASGNPSFFLEAAENSRRTYMERIENMNTDLARERLEELGESGSDSEREALKALQLSAAV